MSIWFPLHMYSLPMAQQWVPLSSRTFFLYPQGIVMLSSDMNTSIFVQPGCISFFADETHWVFQKSEGIFWGIIDELPIKVELPKGHLLLQFSAQGMVTRSRFRRYWISFHDMVPISIPHGCNKPKIHQDSVYWHEKGVFYCWTSKQGTRHIGHIPEELDDFLVGPKDWIAATTQEGVWFLHYGHAFLVSDVMEVLFHRSEEKALLQRLEGVEVLNLQEQRFSTQYLPECDELIGFVEVPHILGLEQRYVFSTALYIKEPEGSGPEFTEPSVVLRNTHTVLGLAGSLWSWNEGDGTPRWIQDIPEFDDSWVGDQGYLLIVEEQLLFISNQGEMEVIEEAHALEDHDVIEVEGLGMFVHFSRIEQTPIVHEGLSLDDSTLHWAWSYDGMWIDIR